MANITIIAFPDFEKRLQENDFNYENRGVVREEGYNLKLNLKEISGATLISFVMMLPPAISSSLDLINTLKKHVQQTEQRIFVQTDGAFYEFNSRTPESEYLELMEDLKTV